MKIIKSIFANELVRIVPWGRNKNEPISKCRIFLKNGPILIRFLVKIQADYKFFFFTRVFSSIEPVFQKLQAKMYFFTFSKTLKNTYMRSKIQHPKHWHYKFFSYFGFGSKHSIAIFSAIQNVIWSWIDDFRAFWKLPDFPLLACFFTWFFTVFACKISTYFHFSFIYIWGNYMKIDENVLFLTVFTVFPHC